MPDPKPVTERQRKNAWLEARRQRLTGTDLPAIMGIRGAYGTPETVWLSKVGAELEEPDEEYLRLGQLVQPITLNIYAEKLGIVIEHADPYELVRHDASILAASLDARWKAAPRAPVDAKNVGVRTSEWGDDGSAVVPDRYLIQLQVQMIVTGTPFADLAVNFANRRVGTYRVPADEETQAGIIEFAGEWWNRHVLNREPPPVTGSHEWARWFAAQVPRVEAYLHTDVYIDQQVELLRLYRTEREQAEALEDLTANRLKAAIVAAGASGIDLGPKGKIHFRQSKDRVSTDWEALARSLAYQAGINIDEVLNTYTTVSPGRRTFRLALTPKEET